MCGVCVCVQAHVAHVCQDRRPDPRPRVSLATETGIAAAAAAAAAPRPPSSEHSRLTPLPPPPAHTGPIRARSSSCVLSNSAGPGLISVFFLGLGSSCLNRWPASQGSTSLVRQHYCLIAPSLSSGDTSVSWQRDRTLLLPIWTHDKDWSVIGTVGTSVGQFSSSRRRRLARLCSWPIQHAPWSFSLLMQHAGTQHKFAHPRPRPRPRPRPFSTLVPSNSQDIPEQRVH